MRFGLLEAELDFDFHWIMEMREGAWGERGRVFRRRG